MQTNPRRANSIICADPWVQHAAEFRRSPDPATTDDRQVATAIMTVDPKDDPTVELTVDVDVGRCAL